MELHGRPIALAALLLAMPSAWAGQDAVQEGAPSKVRASVESGESAEVAERRLKLEAMRARRLQAEAEADTAEARLRALAADPAAQARRRALLDWALVIHKRVEANWVRPRSEVPSDYPCAAQVHLARSGDVEEIAFPQLCSENGRVEKQISKAIRAASPLPMPTDPMVFKENLLLKFSPPTPRPDSSDRAGKGLGMSVPGR